MARADFFSSEGQARVTAAVRRVEAATAAEVVVQVRQAAGKHRDADYLCGAALGLVVLGLLLFAPREFSLASFPVQVALAFGLGAWLSSRLPGLRRLFTTRRARAAEVHRAARAAFHDLGVARCSGRWGLLVLVAMLERRVELVPDLGIDPGALEPGWGAAVAAMEAAVGRGDLDGFVAGLERLGPLLGRQHPRRDDDLDELPDAPAPAAAGDGELA